MNIYQIKNKMKAAVFAVASPNKIRGLICATTREDGTIGLPGGKVDDGENIFAAVEREAFEEGWNIKATKTVLKTEIRDGFKIMWIKCHTRTNPIVHNHKEKSRGIMPIAVPPSMLTGFGNEFLSK